MLASASAMAVATVRKAPVIARAPIFCALFSLLSAFFLHGYIELVIEHSTHQTTLNRMANVMYGGVSHPYGQILLRYFNKSVCTNKQLSPSGQTEPKPRELNSNRGREEKEASLLASLPLNCGRKLCYEYTYSWGCERSGEMRLY